MSVNGIGVGFPAWRDMGKAQRNGSGTGFAGRMAGTDMVREGLVKISFIQKQEKGFLHMMHTP